MFERADRNDLVEGALFFAKIRLDNSKLLAESEAFYFTAHRDNLFRRGVGSGDVNAVPWCNVEHELAEPASDVNDGFAVAQAQLATNMLICLTCASSRLAVPSSQ